MRNKPTWLGEAGEPENRGHKETYLLYEIEYAIQTAMLLCITKRFRNLVAVNCGRPFQSCSSTGSSELPRGLPFRRKLVGMPEIMVCRILILIAIPGYIFMIIVAAMIFALITTTIILVFMRFCGPVCTEALRLKLKLASTGEVGLASGSSCKAADNESAATTVNGGPKDHIHMRIQTTGDFGIHFVLGH